MKKGILIVSYIVCQAILAILFYYIVREAAETENE